MVQPQNRTSMILYCCSAFKFIIYQFIFALCFTKITILLRQTHTHSFLLYKGSLCSYLLLNMSCLESGERCLIFFMYFWQFAAKICLLTSFRDTCFVEIVPQYQTPQRGKVPLLYLLVTTSGSATQKTLHTVQSSH